MIEELQNRQFQLERLSDEGKPLCEEIHRNSEQVLFQAEQEVDERELLNRLREALGEEIKTSEEQEPQEKAPIAYKPKKKIKVTDAEAWAEKLKERQAKKNERAGAVESDRPDA